MIFPINKRKRLGNKAIAVVITAGLSMSLIPGPALAKRSGGDEERSEYYGLVQERPYDGQQGEWVIGGRTFIADQGTEFDEAEGPLREGSCAKVQMRNGRVHEIDSEPMHDCQ